MGPSSINNDEIVQEKILTSFDLLPAYFRSTTGLLPATSHLSDELENMSNWTYIFTELLYIQQ